jgi:hypothetical protein
VRRYWSSQALDTLRPFLVSLHLAGAALTTPAGPFAHAAAISPAVVAVVDVHATDVALDASHEAGAVTAAAGLAISPDEPIGPRFLGIMDRRFLAFIRQLHDGRHLTDEQAAAAPRLWARVRQLQPHLLPPHTGIAEDGSLLMAWDRGHHHLDLEVLPNGTVEWFYLDRASDRAEGEDVEAGGDLPGDFTARLGDLASA